VPCTGRTNRIRISDAVSAATPYPGNGPAGAGGAGPSDGEGGRPLRIVVVGGGMAGLGAARVLEAARAQDASVDWHLYEQDPRFGGKVQTVRRDGFVVEGGPDSAIIEKPWPITTAREVGIGDRFLDCNEDIRKSFVFTRGRLHELPEGIILMVPTRMVPFAMSRLMTWPGKVRMGLDLILPRGGAATAGPSGGAVGSAMDESLGDFVRRRLGREALQRIAEPIVAGIHAGDPEQMSVRATFPMFLDMELEYRSLILAMLKRRKARQQAAAARGGSGAHGGAASAPGAAGSRPPGPRSYFYSFKTGLQDLSDAIVASLPADRLHAGTGVTTMTECGAGCGARAGSGAYALQLSDGTRVIADAVVLATPAWASGDLLRAVAPLAAADLASIDYVSTATASVAFRADQVGHDLKGFGFVVPRAEDRPVMATTWSSSKFDGRAPEGRVLLRSFLGRAGREAAAQLDDDEMAAVVRAELRDIMGITAEPEFVEIFRWPRGMPQYRVGHVELVAHIEAAVARVPGIELAGGAYHGIGIGDCLREGSAAAERALDHVRGLPEDEIPLLPPDLPAADGLED
jgi:oxygen-dependent protoporphyrinogen oxidase